MAYASERYTTGQLRLPKTYARKSYNGHDKPKLHREEHQEVTDPYQRKYTTTREDRGLHRPQRKIATGSPYWEDPAEPTVSSSRRASNNTRTSQPRGPSNFRQSEYLGPDPGAFEKQAKRREENHSGRNDSRAFGPPRQRSPARSHHSNGSRASHSTSHDGLTPIGRNWDVDSDTEGRDYHYPSSPEREYDPDPPTPGKCFEDAYFDGDAWRHPQYSPATSHYDCPPLPYQR